MKRTVNATTENHHRRTLWSLEDATDVTENSVETIKPNTRNTPLLEKLSKCCAGLRGTSDTDNPGRRERDRGYEGRRDGECGPWRRSRAQGTTLRRSQKTRHGGEPAQQLGGEEGARGKRAASRSAAAESRLLSPHGPLRGMGAGTRANRLQGPCRETERHRGETEMHFWKTVARVPAPKQVGR